VTEKLSGWSFSSLADSAYSGCTPEQLSAKVSCCWVHRSYEYLCICYMALCHWTALFWPDSTNDSHRFQQKSNYPRCPGEKLISL